MGYKHLEKALIEYFCEGNKNSIKALVSELRREKVGKWFDPKSWFGQRALIEYVIQFHQKKKVAFLKFCNHHGMSVHFHLRNNVLFWTFFKCTYSAHFSYGPFKT